MTAQDASLAVNRPDGASVGSLFQVNGDLWILPAVEGGTPPVAAVFWRDDAGAVEQVVTRAGIATREDAGAEFDAVVAAMADAGAGSVSDAGAGDATEAAPGDLTDAGRGDLTAGD